MGCYKQNVNEGVVKYMDVEFLHNIKTLNILVIGDFMVDKYIEGNVSRISPEAPVPVLEVTNKISKLGGAGNVVNNIAMLGAKVRTVGCIGLDIDGQWIKGELNSKDIDTNFLMQSENVKTIVKTRLVSKKQQFLRCDEEVIQDASDEFYGFVSENIDSIFEQVDVLIISDYGKGTIRKDIAQLLIRYANTKHIVSVVDPKGTDYTKYSGAFVCTPNMNELRQVSRKNIKTEIEIEKNGRKLKEGLQIKNLMITRSEKGISLIGNENIKKDFPAIEKDVVDVTGAGDTVVSVVAVCLGVGYTIEECCIVANIAASIVCSKFGTSTLSLNELISSIITSGEFKEIDLQVAKYIVSGLHEKGKKLVFTNGCFDLLHAGHIHSFLQAKKFGDVLIVAINSDSSVKKIKGDKRPIISQENRIKMLCSIECVDYVVVMDDTTPERILKILKPDIVVKGKDWEGKEMPEKTIIESYGGSMIFIDLEKGLSTTNIINRISEVYN